MVPFDVSLVTQAKSLLGSLNKKNIQSTTLELTQLAETFCTQGSSVILQLCLKEIESREGRALSSDLKHLVVTSVLDKVIENSRFSDILKSCLSQNSSLHQEPLLKYLKGVSLSTVKNLRLGLALLGVHDTVWKQLGFLFLKKAAQQITPDTFGQIAPEDLQSLLREAHSLESLKESCQTSLEAWKVQGLCPSTVLPLSSKTGPSFDSLREEGKAIGARDLSKMHEDIHGAMDGAAVFEEIGFDCTDTIEHCKDVLLHFSDRNERDAAKILAVVARYPLRQAEDDSQGSLELKTWNLQVLVPAMKETFPQVVWSKVAGLLDHEGFFVKDHDSFATFMALYSQLSPDPFPTSSFCSSVWRNIKGQLSLIVHAATCPGEVFSFSHSPRIQEPLEGLQGHKSPVGTPNLAWLSLDLLEIICRIGESGFLEAVRALLEHPLKICPEILVVGLAQVKTEMNTVRNEVLSLLLPSFIIGNPNASIVLHRVWFLNRETITAAMVDIHAQDPSTVSRILDVCQDMKALGAILETTPFSFSLDLACLASRREYLNLEKWLHDTMLLHHEQFFRACLQFLQLKIAADFSGQGQLLQPSLPIESLAIFLKVLQAASVHMQGKELAEEFKLLYASAAQLSLRGSAGHVMEQGTTLETFASDVEEEANLYFQKIYVGKLSIDEVVDMLRRFSASNVPRERAIYSCMIQSLFDEYRFFPRYPDKELAITAILFGSLIKHQLVTSRTLGMALRCVLDALKKPPDNKMFSFGLTALEKFLERVPEWPQCCSHLLMIPHLRELRPDIYSFVEAASLKASQQPEGGSLTSPSDSLPSASTSLAVEDGGLLVEDHATSAGLDTSFPEQLLASEAQEASQTTAKEIKEKHMPFPKLVETAIPAELHEPQVSTTSASSLPPRQQHSKQEMLVSSKNSAGGTTRTASAGFGHALNIETLVAAAEKRGSPLEVPGSDVQDKVAFLINNIASSNVEIKAKEALEIVKESHYPWFAQYLVMKRASIEPNFHDLYLKFINQLGSKQLHKDIMMASYENCKVLLRSELIKSSSEERSLLKNIGSWLGKLTIGRNQALRAKEIDPKSLIIEAYEKGLMIAVVPFTSKILEPCKTSLAYQPPNPWTMGILGLLAEIYNLPNLKLNLKFDIEVLFKSLGVDLKDVKATKLLQGRQRALEGNPDFSNKDLVAQMSAAASTPVSSASASPQPPQEAQTGSTAADVAHVGLKTQRPSPQSISQLPDVEKDVAALLGEHTSSSQANALGGAMFTSSQATVPIPNLAAYLTLNPKLGPLTQQLQLPRVVPLAIERAIREIITPVVDRSCTIACMTTRELVLKDFAMEADETKALKAANLMAASLAGSLAHVTCKEPLRLAMANHLRSLLDLGSMAIDPELIQLVTSDNLDLGCAVIEKAATEKALRDLDETLGPALALRRKQREALGAAFFDASVYAQGNLARLPESLRPKPIRLTPSQQRVYEDFARLPWQTQMTAPNGQASSQEPSMESHVNVPETVSGPLPAARPPLSAIGMSSGTSVGSFAALSGNIPPAAGLAQGARLSPASGNMVFRSAARGEDVASGRAAAISSFPISPIPSTGSVDSSALDRSSPKPSVAVEEPAAMEPLLATGNVVEKCQQLLNKAEPLIAAIPSVSYQQLPADHEIRGLVHEIQKVIRRGQNCDEAALITAQKVFERLFEHSANRLHVSTCLSILTGINDVCKQLLKELTGWIIYLDEERKFNKEITHGLVEAELINMADFSVHLANLIDGGHSAAATEFAVYIVQSCVVQDSLVSGEEILPILEALSKISQRSGAPESLHQLVELAKSSVSGKEGRVVGAKTGPGKEDSKLGFGELLPSLPTGYREQVIALFEEWVRGIDSSPDGEAGGMIAISQLQQMGFLHGDESADRFFRVLIELVVNHALSTEAMAVSAAASGLSTSPGIQMGAIDMFTKFFSVLVKQQAETGGGALVKLKLNLLTRVLSMTTRIILRDADEKKTFFNARPYFRLLVNILGDFSTYDPSDPLALQVLVSFATCFQALQPLRIPSFSFAWLELISHRCFMPKILLASGQHGWPFFHRLLLVLFKFMEPFLRNAELSDPVRLLYKGTLRVLLVLLHDFPEFLCDHHFSFCDVIPPSCIQMRNLILSAFPRNMRLPDPFTPNLKVDLLPEISQPPRIMSDVDAVLRSKQLKGPLDDYLQMRQPSSFLHIELKQHLLLSPNEAAQMGTVYNVPLINSLVLYVGMQAISQLQSKTTPQQLAAPSAPITHSAPMDVFQQLVTDLEPEGRYLFLNAIANQLRYPNNHTHYFSCVLLYLFAEASQEIIQEQVTRVLLERLIVNRPHPWGLLITFIELIKNPRYNFWSHAFTRCAPEIKKLFESVARSCMGPTPKVDDES